MIGVSLELEGLANGEPASVDGAGDSMSGESKSGDDGAGATGAAGVNVGATTAGFAAGACQPGTFNVCPTRILVGSAMLLAVAISPTLT